MREIKAREITAAVARLSIEACSVLGAGLVAGHGQRWPWKRRL